MNISDQAIDKRKMVLSTTIASMFQRKKKFGDL